MFFGKLKRHLFLVSQLRSSINAGLPLLRTIDVLIEHSSDFKLRRLFKDVKNSVSSGQSFSSAIKKYTGYLDPIFVSCVEAGEKSGQLEELLTSLENYYENMLDIKRKALIGLAWPVIETFLIFVIVCALPTVVEYLVPNPQSIPFYAFFVNARNIVFEVILFVFAFYLVNKFCNFIPFLKKIKDFFWLNVPIVGKIIKKTNLYRFLITFSFLLSAGLDIRTIIKYSANNIDNEYMKASSQKALNAINQGANITQSLKSMRIFPKDVLNAIAIGEESGKLEHSIRVVANQYINDVFQTMQLIPKVLFPVILILLAFFVLKAVIVLYIDTYKQIFNMMQ